MRDDTPYPWEPDGDVVVVETPEQTHVELRTAPFGTRILAASLDTAVIVALALFVQLVIWLAAGVAGAVTVGADALGMVAALAVVAQFLIGVLYFVWWEVRSEGQTWGKRVMGIRTVLASGQGITLGPALIRNLARQIDQFPLLWAVPSLVPGRRRLGDLLAGTYVILTAPPTELRGGAPLDWPADRYRDLEERLFPLAGQTAERLYREDLDLIEYVLGRVQAAPPARRPRLLRALARRYVRRLGLDDEIMDRAMAEPRRLLQELALFLRDRYEGAAY